MNDNTSMTGSGELADVVIYPSWVHIGLLCMIVRPGIAGMNRCPKAYQGIQT